MTGNSMSDTSTPSYIATKFMCANGAVGNVQAKNCRTEAYWNNYATKFCKDLCEVSADASIDNAANTDPSCVVSIFNVLGKCIGAPPAPASCFTGCTGKACGDDGCGGSCGTCTGTDVCIDTQCVTPQCSCERKACGEDDGCGYHCQGSCSISGQICQSGVCGYDCSASQVQIRRQTTTCGHPYSNDFGQPCETGTYCAYPQYCSPNLVCIN
jgi:hypothetical protein